MPGTGRARRIRAQPIGHEVHGNPNEDMDICAPPNSTLASQQAQQAEVNLIDHLEGPTNQINSNSSSQPICKGRGPNRGLSLVKRRKIGERFNIIVSNDRRRIVGRNATDLISEAGVVVREIAPLDKENWKHIPDEKKNQMWDILKENFRLSEDVLVKKVVMAQLNRQYCNYRSNLHVKYYKPHGSVDRALRHCPPDVPLDQWQALCLYFNSTKFKKRSGINQNNRSQQVILHSGGSKGFARREYEMRDPVTNEYPRMSTRWEKTHYSNKKGDWVNEAAKNVYDEVQQKIISGTEDGVETMTEDHAFQEVLGYKSSYVRGRGLGPKPKSSCFDASMKDVEEARARELVEARKELEEARKESEEAKREAEQARRESEEARKESGEARKESLLLKERILSMETDAAENKKDWETRFNQMQNMMMGFLSGRSFSFQH